MESYEEYLDTQEKGGKIPMQVIRNFLSKLQFIHWVLLIVLILIINNLIKKGENPNWLFIAIGAIIILWILSLMKTEEKKMLPRHVAEKVAISDLNRLISIDSAYPHGTKAIATGVFKAHHLDSGNEKGWKLDKYNFGFEIRIPNKSPLHIIYQMNPYPPGNCQGIVYIQIPWDGTDIKDYQIIIPERTIIEEKK